MNYMIYITFEVYKDFQYYSNNYAKGPGDQFRHHSDIIAMILGQFSSEMGHYI